MQKDQPEPEDQSQDLTSQDYSDSVEGTPNAGPPKDQDGPSNPEPHSQKTNRSEDEPARQMVSRLDGLLLCFVRLSQQLGQPVSEADVRAAVPASAGGLTADQFCRAADRLSFQVRRERVTPAALRAMPTPYVLVGAPGQANRIVLENRGDQGLLIWEAESRRERLEDPGLLLEEAAEALLVKSGGPTLQSASWRQKITKRVRGVLLELILASLAINVLALATPLFVMTLYNKVIGQQDLDTLNILALGMVAVYGFDALLRSLRGYVSAHTGGRIDALIGSEVMHHLIHLPFPHFERTPSGLIGERMRQLDTIRSFFTGQLPMTLVDLAFVFVFVAVLFMIHDVMAWITLASMPLFIAVSAVFHRQQRQLEEQAFKARATKASHLSETVHNALTVKSMGMEPEVERRWDERLALAAWTGFKASNISNIATTLGMTLQFLVSLAILYVGANLVIAGQMTVGALIAANILASRALAPVRMMLMAWVQLQEVKAAFQRVDAIMEEPSEIVPEEAGPAPRFVGNIQLEEISFGFNPAERGILNQIDLTIPAGTVLGIIGPSGSGKSTLVRLIQGLYPATRGRVLYDGNDISHLSASALRQQIGVVPQESQLFSGTVRENILMGAQVKDPERVVAVARFIGAHGFIQRLPNGYETPLGERGSGLSAGQRQMICIARALIRNPRVLILDEATSDLDPVSEEYFLKALQKASRGRTVIIVSHRLSPFMIADRVALLINGRIERVGPPAEVIAFAKARMSEAVRAAQGQADSPAGGPRPQLSPYGSQRPKGGPGSRPDRGGTDA
ncbi:peptidase domain-containing ABC transporter [Rhodovibrionaceae bacterium A322]